MERRINALEELAERLTAKDVINVKGKAVATNVDFDALVAAQRIVAELGKPERIDGQIAREIMVKCRAIAEEGVGDGE